MNVWKVEAETRMCGLCAATVLVAREPGRPVDALLRDLSTSHEAQAIQGLSGRRLGHLDLDRFRFRFLGFREMHVEHPVFVVGCDLAPVRILRE